MCAATYSPRWWNADQFKNLEKLGTKAVAQGQVGELFGAPVVEVPDELICPQA